MDLAKAVLDAKGVIDLLMGDFRRPGEPDVMDGSFLISHDHSGPAMCRENFSQSGPFPAIALLF